jgi:hypothetical protein
MFVLGLITGLVIGVMLGSLAVLYIMDKTC